MTSPSTIAQRVAEMHAAMPAELAASGLPAGIAPAGTVLPDAGLLDLHGTPTTLQKPDGSLTMQQKNDLAFTVVSDPGNTIAGRLGILAGPSEEARAVQLQLGLDLTSVNADGTVTLPMPATIILDASRTVRWIDVHPDYSTRTESRQVINALDHLGL
jgi:hypothetical protein